jgi:hypothetical protein
MTWPPARCIEREAGGRFTGLDGVPAPWGATRMATNGPAAPMQRLRS